MKIAGIVFFGMSLLLSCSPKLKPDNNWAEGKWILVELKKVPVQISGIPSRDAHIEFRPSTRNYLGFGGCNNITGTYSLEKNKIKFTSTGARLASCPDVPFESTFLTLLSEVDNYTISGNNLTLKKGKQAVIKLQRR